MSINRNTKAYWKRVKAVTRALRWPGYKRLENGSAVPKTIADVIDEQTAGAPRYLIEDALIKIIAECRESADYNERTAREEREKADEMERQLESIRRPKLRLASGGNAA